MEKRFLCGEEVSLLGFGAMRLPTQEDGTIDRVKAGRLVDTLYQKIYRVVFRKKAEGKVDEIAARIYRSIGKGE